jgi:hypothetical protein
VTISIPSPLAISISRTNIAAIPALCLCIGTNPGSCKFELCHPKSFIWFL